MSDSENQNPENDTPRPRFTPRMGQPAADAGDRQDAAPVSDESAADAAATSTVRATGAASESTPEAGDTAEDAALVGVGAHGEESTDTASVETPPAMTATTRGRRRDENRPKRGPMRPAGPTPLGRFAIVETGGKQYRVSVGDSISVERLEGDAGSTVTFDRVLLVGGDGATRVGAPIVDGASVTATIDSQYRGEKIIVFKFKPKKRYRRRTGHRQSLTKLSITGISA